VAKRRLDPKIMAKLAKTLGIPPASVSVRVSKTAAKRGIAAEAAMVVLAKQHDIGTAHFQRNLSADMQSQIRGALQDTVPSLRRRPAPSERGVKQPRAHTSKKQDLKRAIAYVVQDAELLSRCQDLLMGNGKFDRAINQATLVLEDRIRKKATPPTRLVGEPLVNYAFKEDSSKTVLRVASGDPDDQRGFTQIMRGVVPAFRNSTHHHIVDSLTREEALRVVGFVDVLLGVVNSSVKIP
jgi:hypothetical protein